MDRSKNRCKDCSYFAETKPENELKGECHRYPPKVFLFPIPSKIQSTLSPSVELNINVFSGFPTVDKNSFCGEFYLVVL
jgi:hypothetical protein